MKPPAADRVNDRTLPACGESGGSTVAGRRRTPWRRFHRNRLTQVSGVLLGVMLVTSLVTLPFSMRWYNAQELNTAVRHPPSASPVVRYARHAGMARVTGEARSDRKSEPMSRLAYVASSWFGHDDLGRSLFYRVMPGFLVSLSVGLAAAAVAVLIGTSWGAVSALAGGRVDLLMMRVVDVLYGLPYILMVILLKIALTHPLTILLGGHTKWADLVILYVAIGGVSWLTMARVIRGQVLSLRTLGFVEAARAAGAGPFYILRRHMLPNLIGPIVTYATLVVPQAILQESFLSFLGIGVQQPTPSLGRLAADGVEAVNTFVGYWWMLVFPCGFLVLALLALNFLGDALRDAFDPKSAATVI